MMVTRFKDSAPSGVEYASTAYATSRQTASRTDYGDRAETIRHFKMHKSLPHPLAVSTNIGAGRMGNRYASAPQCHEQPALHPGTDAHGSADELPLPPYRGSLSRARRATGPSMPPTPPAHSRNSSTSHGFPKWSTTTGGTLQEHNVHGPSTQGPDPTTPLMQQSPPTPDVTPPQIAGRTRALRPTGASRTTSRATSGSRADSFKTAKESLGSSDDDEDGMSTLRAIPTSARTSQTTVRGVPNDLGYKTRARPSHVGLGLGLETSLAHSEARSSPRSRWDTVHHDGDWLSDHEVVEEWDDNLMRMVMVRRRRPDGAPAYELTEDYMSVPPTKAANVPRSLQAQGRALANTTSAAEYSSGILPGQRRATAPATSTIDTWSPVDQRSVSNVSVISAIIQSPATGSPPTMRRGLRRVNRLDALRRPVDSPHLETGAAQQSVIEPEAYRQPHRLVREQQHDGHAWSSTKVSLPLPRTRKNTVDSSRRQAVEVTSDHSVVSQGEDQSMRSGTSKATSRSVSSPLSSAFAHRDVPPSSSRTRRQDWPLFAVEDGSSSNRRALEHPPEIPRRRSSLSNPASGEASRPYSVRGSQHELEKSSLDDTNSRLQSQSWHSETNDEANSGQPPALLPAFSLERSLPSPDVPQPLESPLAFESSPKFHSVHHVSMDRYGDPLFGKRVSTQATPFSMKSDDTMATSAAEIAEAQAVSIAHHQNKSLVMVDSKPTEGSEGDRGSQSTVRHAMRPSMSETPLESSPSTTSSRPGRAYATPPQVKPSLDEIDSPLKNPRYPPEPPAIQLCPATPSGLTPVDERSRQLGDVYNDEIAAKQKRGLSLVRQALTRRRSSEGSSSARKDVANLFVRSLSRSRMMHRETAENPDKGGHGKRPGTVPGADVYPNADEKPSDEARLHPFWQPASAGATTSEEDSQSDSGHGQFRDGKSKKYPPRSARPMAPQRSLSGRLKRTFAIMPLNDEDEEQQSFDKDIRRRDADEGPDRRTVQRSPSGNLRVVQQSSDEDQEDHMHKTKYPPAAGDRRLTSEADGGRGRSIRKLLRSASLTRKRSASSGPDERKGDGGEIDPASTERVGRWSRQRQNSTDTAAASTLTRTTSSSSIVSEKFKLMSLPRRLSQHRREQRGKELRAAISAPMDFRDGVGEIVRKRWATSAPSGEYESNGTANASETYELCA